MAGGIIGNSGNYAVVANCATFGNVYAASPAATSYGGLAGGLVGMMAGKQYNSYATGDITIANGGLAKDHHWVGALDGQVTTSGTTGGTAYPAEGAARTANYYAEDAVLKEEIYENNGATLKNTVTDEPTDRGFSTQQGYDKVMVSTAVARSVMASADFAATLNSNIAGINGILAAYGITGIALREWQLDGSRVLPAGDVWTTGAIIDSCSVSGTFYLNNTEGNHFVGGLVGRQYKGATINSHVSVRATGIVDGSDLAEVGGLVGLNNRGLIANCWTDNDLLYASGNRENGNEGMAVVSNLVACNAGALVNCYASGDLTTREFSTYAGMVSGWVTGIGKSYNCWYDLDSTMINGASTDNPVTINPVAAIGTKVASGVTEEGDAYTGGLVDKMTAYSAAGYAAIADGLNASFTAFPIDITAYGIDSTALKT